MDFKTLTQEATEKVFLALAVWREARGESYEGKAAVASSIMNRVARPSWWGHDLLSVIFKKWQYSSMTDPKDKQLTTWPQKYAVDWIECLQAASNAVDGIADKRASENPVPGADGYYDISISPPKWATPETFVKQIGKLRFYNLDRDFELPLP
jgi:spore germination cell wall hydrolase CwlJ-like protein